MDLPDRLWMSAPAAGGWPVSVRMSTTLSNVETPLMERSKAPLLHRYRTSTAKPVGPANAPTGAESTTTTPRGDQPTRKTVGGGIAPSAAKRTASAPPSAVVKQKAMPPPRDKRIRRGDQGGTAALAAKQPSTAPSGSGSVSVHRHEDSPPTISSSPALTDSMARSTTRRTSSCRPSLPEVSLTASRPCADPSCVHSRQSIAEFMEMQQELRRCYADIITYEERLEELMRRLAASEEAQASMAVQYEARCSEMEKEFLLKLSQQAQEFGSELVPTVVASQKGAPSSDGAGIAPRSPTESEHILRRRVEEQDARISQLHREVEKLEVLLKAEQRSLGEARAERDASIAECERLLQASKPTQSTNNSSSLQRDPAGDAERHCSRFSSVPHAQAPPPPEAFRTSRVPLISPSPLRQPGSRSPMQRPSSAVMEVETIGRTNGVSPNATAGASPSVRDDRSSSLTPRRAAPPPPAAATTPTSSEMHHPCSQGTSPLPLQSARKSLFHRRPLATVASATTTKDCGRNTPAVASVSTQTPGPPAVQNVTSDGHASEPPDTSADSYLVGLAHRCAAPTSAARMEVDMKGAMAQCQELVRALLDKEHQITVMALERNRYRRLYEVGTSVSNGGE